MSLIAASVPLLSKAAFNVASLGRSTGLLAGTLGSGVWTVVIILSLVGWTGIYRLVRAEWLSSRFAFSSLMLR